MSSSNNRVEAGGETSGARAESPGRAGLVSGAFTRGRVRITRPARERFTTAAVIAIMHLIPIGLFITGTRLADWAAFGILYVVMIVGVGAGLHRYFAHRSFETSRTGQFLIGLVSGIIMGNPIAFSGKHRLHHRHSDTPRDVHSPKQGFLYCWFGSLVDEGYPEQDILKMCPDLTPFPELMWLHRHCWAPGVAVAAGLFAIGGFSMMATGYCLSFVAVLHATSAVNYFCHRGSNRRYDTRDDSTNRPVLSFFILGEGYHHNHHYCPSSARSGFLWYEIDVIFYVLKGLAATGLIWDLRQPPRSLLGGAVDVTQTRTIDFA